MKLKRFSGGGLKLIKRFSGCDFKRIHGYKFYKFFKKDLNQCGLKFEVSQVTLDPKPFTEQIIDSSRDIEIIRHYELAFSVIKRILDEGFPSHSGAIGKPDDAQIVVGECEKPSFCGWKTDRLKLLETGMRKLLDSKSSNLLCEMVIPSVTESSLIATNFLVMLLRIGTHNS